MVRVLGQKREGGVDGGGVGLRVVILITGQSVAHVVRCVWKLFVKASRMLQQTENCHTHGKRPHNAHSTVKLTQVIHCPGIKHNESGGNWEKTVAI